MNANRNLKLKVFVDAVLTRIASYVKTKIDNVTVEYNHHTDVYWFILSVNKAFLEDQPAGSLDELEVVPRIVQLGETGGGALNEMLLVFMNERGVYTNGIPHTLPAARCTNAQSMDAAVTIFNYLTRGVFTAGFDYRMIRPLGVSENQPKPVQLTEKQIRTNRDKFKKEMKQKQVAMQPNMNELVLHTRLKNILKKNGILTAKQLARKSAGSLLAMDGIGKTSVYQIQRQLERVNLSLKGDPWATLDSL